MSKVASRYRTSVISKHITLYERKGAQSSTLLLFFPWVSSSSSSHQSYFRLYKDCDILSVQGGAAHLLSRRQNSALSGRISAFLEGAAYDRLFVHCFSIGAFIYMSWYLSGPVPRLRGQIFDSVACGEAVKLALGLSINSSSLPLARWAVYYVMLAGLRSSGVVGRVERMAEVFVGLSLPPSLFYYSLDDPMCDSQYLLSLIALLRQRNHVRTLSWEFSSHAAHLSRHPKAYISAHKDFTQFCGL